MPSTFLFMRHAETELAGTFCGSTDVSLNEKGRLQLPGLLARTADLKVDVIYSSDLKRAMETASAFGVPVVPRPGLRQIDFGHWETLTWQQIEEANPAFAARWVAEFPNVTPPDGEPIPLFKHRVLEEMAFIRQEAAGRTVGVMTHSTVLRVLLEELGHFSAHHAWERTRDYTCSLRARQQSATGYLDFSNI
jgi:alpha-ribazole phosphatase/probable phosphoglycerate mutase